MNESSVNPRIWQVFNVKIVGKSVLTWRDFLRLQLKSIGVKSNLEIRIERNKL